MDVQEELLHAINLAGENDFAGAQEILKSIIAQEPLNVDAWLTLADVVQNPDLAEKCLRHVLTIDPANPVALQKLNLYGLPGEFPQDGLKFAPQSLDERLESVALPSEWEDPWEAPPQDLSAPELEASDEPDSEEESQDSPSFLRNLGKLRNIDLSGRWLEYSLIGVLFLMALFVLGLFLFLPDNAAGEIEAPATKAASSNNNDPLAVIIANIRASNAESLPHYMATIHSKSPSYQSTKEMTEQAFSLFDLSYKVSRMKITEQTEDEAVVAFTLTTRKIRGPDFRDNRISGDMILRKEDGRWKIYNQVVHDVKYLN